MGACRYGAIASLLMAGLVHAVEVPTDRIIVRLKGGAPAKAYGAAEREAIAARLQSRSLELIRPHRVMGDGAQVMRLFRRMTDSEIARRFGRLDDPDVIEIVPDRLFQPALVPNDSLYASQWYLTAANGINAPAAWDITTGAASLVVGIVDTGKLPHAELASRWVGGYDFVGDTNRSNDADARDADAADPGDWVTAGETASGPLQGCPQTDSRWHGTLMAGVIGAASNNAAGIAGINWNSKLLPVRVAGKCGAYESDIADGMRWAVGIAVSGVPANANTADVLNVSLSATGACSGALQSAINEVAAAGAPIVVAAGNNSVNASGYSPGNCANVIAVGAVDRNGGKASYTNFGALVALSAPGGKAQVDFTGGDTQANQWVLSTSNTGLTLPLADTTASVFGTSIATAQVTGIASLMLSVSPTLAPQHVSEILRTTSRTFPTNTTALGSQADCTTALCGAGIAEAAKAVAAALAWGTAEPAVAGGSDVSFGLRSDGTVFGWGAPNMVGNGGASAYYATAVSSLAGITRLSGGTGHTLALRADGTVWAWGYNFNGRLGNGNTTFSNVPVRSLGGLVGRTTTRIAAGPQHSLALTSDGKLWAWGDNFSGQYGDGTTTESLVPIEVTTITGLTEIAGGYARTAAVKSDGTAWLWGNSVLTPAQVAGLANITAVAAGDYFRLWLRSDGTVWAEGDGAFGQLGNGATAFSSTPVQVSGLAGVTRIAAGREHGLALKGDGTVWTWGRNHKGQLGDGTTVNSTVPVRVQGLTGVSAIGAGFEHSLAVKPDGSVYAWGSNFTGMLGSDFFVNHPLPLRVVGDNGIGFLSLGVTDPANFAPVTDAGLGSEQTSNTITVSGIGATAAIAIASGEYSLGCTGTFVSTAGTIANGGTVCVRRSAAATCETTVLATLSIAGLADKSFSVSTIECDTTPTAFLIPSKGNAAPSAAVTSEPVTITGINTPSTVSISGGTYSVGCTGTYTGTDGPIAPGQQLCVRVVASAASNGTASAIVTIGGVSADFTVFTAAAAGFVTPARVDGSHNFGIAVRTNGTLAGWGNALLMGNPVGAGTGPVDIPFLSGVARVSILTWHALALRVDGTAWAWGRNSSGQLGDGAITDRAFPRRPGGALAGATFLDVAAGNAHSLAVRGDGTVWAWGVNFSRQLGDGTDTDRLLPVAVQGLTGAFTAVGAGDTDSYALRSDATVWKWGSNNGTPSMVTGIGGNVTAISAGYDFALFLRADGTVWSMGRNTYGQLGDGTGVNSMSTPVQVSGLAGVVQISTGINHGLALKGDGTAWAWGANIGNLGDATAIDRLAPVQVQNLTGVVGIGAGQVTSFFVKPDGSLWALGRNFDGQLGTGAAADFLVPTRVLGPGAVGLLDLGVADPTSFAPQTDVPASSVRVSNAIVITGLGAPASFTVSGGEHSVGCNGTFASGGSTIANGQSICLRQTASSSCETTTTATLSVTGLGAKPFAVTTEACDATPLPFSFVTVGNAAPGSPVVSAPVAIGGITTSAQVTVAGGDYSIGCTGTYTSGTGSITNGQSLCARVTASSTPNGTATATVTVGGVAASFHAFSAPPPGYNVPMRVAAAEEHSVFQRSDGAIFATGHAPYLGNGGLHTVTPVAIPTISGVQHISSREWFTLAIRSDGSLWSWGSNNLFQLGDGTNIARTTPVRVGGALASAVVIDAAASQNYGLALKNDGTVWMWGDGFRGDGTYGLTPSPVQVPGLTGITAIAVSANSWSLARKSDGTAWVWGGTTIYTPQQVAGVSNVVAVASSNTERYFLLADGAVWSESGGAPAQVPGLTGITRIRAGNQHAVALKSDGTVWAWGTNFYGQVGDGTFIDRATPVKVLGMSDIVEIGAGAIESFAVKADGSVFAWGSASSGATGTGSLQYLALAAPVLGPGGDGTLSLQAVDTYPAAFAFTPAFGAQPGASMSSNPILVAGLGSGVNAPISVSGGEYSINGGGFTAVAGVVANGASVTVRTNASALYSTTTSVTLSIGAAVKRSSSFFVRTVADSASTAIVARVAAGDSHTLLLSSDRVVSAAGYNGNGQLGNGTTLGLSTLRPVAGLAGAVEVASGAFHGLALRADGTVAAWGSNIAGQLGHGSGNDSERYLVSVAGLTNVVAISAGKYHSAAVKADGTAWAWGLNAEGQVGDGSLVPSRNVPVQVQGLAGVTAIAAGGRHTLALLADGTVRAWGANEAGQLGDGGFAQRNTPAEIMGLFNVVAIAAGDAHSLAITGDGSVVAWGFNAFGQLGDGTTSNRPFPVNVSGLSSDVGIVAAGANHSLAVKAGGAMYAWGNNSNSQIGNGSNANQTVPVLLSAPTGVVAIAGGARHTAAITSARTLYVWGDNFFGQVGNRSGNYSPHSSSLNVLRGDSLISTGAGGSGSGVGTGTNSGSSILAIDNQLTGYSFGAIGQGTSRSVPGKFKNASGTVDVTGVGVFVTGVGFSLTGGCPATLVPDQECTFTVGFNPPGALPYQGELLVQSSVVGAPERRALVGSGVAPATAALALASPGVDFPPQTLYAASPAASLTVTNTGSAALTVANVTSTLADFAATHNCTSVAPGANCVLSITFTPLAPNARTALLSIASNASGGPHPVTVSGTGVPTAAPPPMHSLSVSKTGTGSGTVASTSPAGAIDCGATCSAEFIAGTVVTLTATPAGGSAFTGWSGACTGVGSCSVTMTQAKSVVAAFMVLQAGPTLTLDRAAVGFGGQSMGTTSPEELVIVTNTGNGTLTITAVSLPAGAFARTHDCATLGTGASCTVHVTFSPPVAAGALNSTAPAAATLTVTSAENGSKAVDLTGSGEKSLVSHYYRAILRRAPDTGGKQFWSDQAALMAGLGANVNEAWFAMAQFFFFSAEYASFNRDTTGFVTDLYNTFFNRVPDAGGLAFWVGQINSGMPREVVLAGFMFSPEFVAFTQAIFGNTAARAEVDVVGDFYRGLLARLPDGGGFAHWVGLFRTAQCSGAAAVYAQTEAISSGFATGAEYAGRNRTNAQYVGDLYNALLRRGGDLPGVQHWIGQLDSSGLTREQVRQTFIAQPEYSGRVNTIVNQGCLPP